MELAGPVPDGCCVPGLGLQAWELTGDAYSTHKGDRPWISEMYGEPGPALGAGAMGWAPHPPWQSGAAAASPQRMAG